MRSILAPRAQRKMTEVTQAARRASVEKHFVHVAPAPALARLKRLHDGVLRLMEMFGGVFVLGRVAATDMTATETFPQMDPAIAHLQALLAALATRLHLLDFSQVGTR